ncbi:SDR family oxidoreductase [Desertifilum sp. FACHB-1129]|uniref:Short chain dehydrogenase n=2 Tax=Desertifilum tharense IPPAS B-1220 TaxID=1781255 RepID=A0A1E5QMI9_9CYAN|nr:SDR family oxidoreductase [Desertifilum tharense]MBD2313379.1 SDR family oxidoreductase [Desertifilum sp. FACHB-1129]MBD2324450.1 SDR family oxidoreductase [Desertifilum sp. FACHB-866]MBD2334464.1 SDR family oxidoreductase [Desertifilum sp. FACHB-868]MDA0212767.1 SDR family oxidoreductase [Cyanobacteria bacterium FC1]OEJ75896.1 short chain dehydrogenase [Desertifilum tharense IPPAS B-1220]
MHFTNKTIIITGASAGIGRTLSLSLAQQGANLVLAARDATALAEVADACHKGGGNAIAIPTDVTQPQACQHLIEQAIATFGQIDILVNNAGISMLAPFEQVTDLSIFEQVMQVNYLGAVYCTHYALPYLKTSRGLLVAISSLCGKTAVPTRTGYVASKHALQGFCDTLRIELRGTGVDVLVVSPGFVATDIRKRAFGADGQTLGNSPRDESRGNMSVEECVRQILRAMEKRQREQIMTPKGKVIPWVKLIAPGIVDRLAAKAAGWKS